MFRNSGVCVVATFTKYMEIGSLLITINIKIKSTLHKFLLYKPKGRARGPLSPSLRS